jgi:hypothetical protein
LAFFLSFLFYKKTERFKSLNVDENLQSKGNEMKLKLTIAVSNIMFILLSSLVLASTAFTEYEGSGDFILSTTIDSVSSNTEVHTGCEACCCCPDCPGSYEGIQYLSSDPKIIGDTATTDDGCAEIHQTVVDESNGKTTYTNYDTVLDGEGTASSYYNESYGAYQKADGSGIAYLSFSQYQLLNSDFNYATQTSGLASNGDVYADMFSYYDVSGDPNYQALYYLYLSGDDTYAWFYSDWTDLIYSNLDLTSSDIFLSYYVGVLGSGSYATSTNSNNDMYATGQMVID